jgi:hypothetical protein
MRATAAALILLMPMSSCRRKSFNSRQQKVRHSARSRLVRWMLMPPWTPAETTVIEYREILRREKTCDYPVPAYVADGLLNYTNSLRAGACTPLPPELTKPVVPPLPPAN